jgi:hypothetical protein
MFGVSLPDQGKIIAISALANGVDAFQYMRTYHVFGGKLTMRAEAMLAELEKAGGRVEWKQTTSEICEADFYGPNSQKPFKVKISMEELKSSGVAMAEDPKTKKQYVKSVYAKFSRQMLRARATAEGVRAVCAKAVNGFYAPEEAEDFEPQNEKPSSGWTRGIPQAEAPFEKQPPPTPTPPAATTAPANDPVPPAEAVPASPPESVTKKMVSDAITKWMKAKNENNVLVPREKFLKGRKFADVPTGEYAEILAAVQAEAE